MSRGAGCFIAFEGIEGAGKSTQIERLATALRGRGHTVVTTREPGGTPLGSDLRHLLMHATGEPPVPIAELLLYLADRAQHLARVIRPALAEGQVVLCDRFSGSTIAYQGYGRGLDVDLVERLDAMAREDTTPALTILLDCDVEEGLRRATGDDRFQREVRAFHQRVQAGFHELLRRTPTWVLIRSDRDSGRVAADILDAVLRPGILPACASPTS